MADPYRTNPNPHDSSLETDDMSSFLLNLLHDSSASASAAATFSRSATVPSDSDFRVRDGALAAVIESSSSLNLSDPSRFYAADLENGVDNVFSANRSVFPEDDKVENFDFSREEYEAFEMPNNQVQPRSSKRCRSADVHNMSEKRRRSRINEKLKALQTLIPNSNKTDKASMLDEAIEYLKQLQLQVQMLTMRNGLSLYPGYIPGSAQSMQLPPSGIEFDVGNVMLSANRGVTLPGSGGMMQNAFEISNQNPSTKPTITSNNTGNSIDLGTTIQNHYGLLNQLASSKNMCRDDTLSRLHLDMSCSGNNSSSGVSS